MKNWLNEIRWFIQRGRRGYADCDWWNLDSYISNVLEKAISDLNYKGIQTKWQWKKCGEFQELIECPKRNLLNRIVYFFTLHRLLMEDPDLHRIEQVRRLYKARGLLFIRNFGRLWD